jgi:hypothetical protein
MFFSSKPIDSQLLATCQTASSVGLIALSSKPIDSQLLGSGAVAS